LRLFGEDVTVGAREAAVQKSKAHTSTTGTNGVIDEDLEQVVDGAVPEGDIEVSN
jgi:hypothetical protein